MTVQDSAESIPSAAPGSRPAAKWSDAEIAAIEEIVDLGAAFAAPYVGAYHREACLRIETASGIELEIPEPTEKDAVQFSQRFDGPLKGHFTVVIGDALRAMSDGADGTAAGNVQAGFGETLLSQCVAALETVLGIRLRRVAPGQSAGAVDDGPAFAFTLRFCFETTVAAASLFVTFARSSEAALRRCLAELLGPSTESPVVC